MARPKSELTGTNPYCISVRLTPEQRVMLVKLRGARWIRAKLQEEIDKCNTLSVTLEISEKSS